MRFPWIRALALLCPLLIGGCGGGGSASVDAGGNPAGSTATVGLLITDAPVGRWDQAIATITSVELLGDAGRVTLFSGSQTLDLLKLADFSELFAVSDAVPVGSYSKIRLRLDDLVLNDLDAGGNIVDSVRPKLVGNGKIDLNPRGSFRLAPGDVIVIELDFDMAKSMKITETGNGMLIVRPVVFVNIRTQPLPDGRLTRIPGEITRIDVVSGNLRLCQTGFASEWGDHHQGDPGDDDRQSGDSGPGGFDGERRCVTVNTDDGTGIFGEDGQPQDLADLAVGEEITAIGRLRPFDDEADDDGDDHSDSDARFPDDDRHHFTLDAFVVEEGAPGTYRRIRGSVASAFDAGSGRFDLEIAAGQGIATDAPLPVQLFEKSRIFSRDGDELGTDDLLLDRAALVDGVIVIGGEDLVRSPLVILGDRDEPAAATLEGTIVSIDVEEKTLVVNDGTMDRCVDAATAAIFLVDDADGFSSTRGALDDLRPGQQVSIFGAEGACLSANTILAEQD